MKAQVHELRAYFAHPPLQPRFNNECFYACYYPRTGWEIFFTRSFARIIGYANLENLRSFFSDPHSHHAQAIMEQTNLKL